MTKQAKPTRQPIEVITKEVLGEYPEDVLAYIQYGVEALGWMESLFHAIEELHGKEGSGHHIKNLAGLGKYVAGDMSNTNGCHYEELSEKLQAALGNEEGGAA
ncbi:MAG: hypothetical protein WA056_01575 [Gallionella sp.]